MHFLHLKIKIKILSNYTKFSLLNSTFLSTLAAAVGIEHVIIAFQEMLKQLHILNNKGRLQLMYHANKGIHSPEDCCFPETGTVSKLLRESEIGNALSNPPNFCCFRLLENATASSWL